MFLLLLITITATFASDENSLSSESTEECPKNYISGRYDVCEAKCGEEVPYCIHVEIPWIKEECHCRADKGFVLTDDGDCIPRKDCAKRGSATR
ncbi:hypothetical protein QR680_006281 [Steinernema hermaphroditum]|uniref:TIL domain-containing protein n=1 Tax=Steinernema hermaphroditum TaxID=289476 RepID=A0AA39HX86_9BILA|nr:hypothetical protein QR680_006281 [Steinernema hermaphroditum]